MKAYIATIQILVVAEDSGEAADAISETLRENVLDWAYLGEGAPVSPIHDPDGYGIKRAYPFAVEIADDYQEGDLFY